MGQAQHQSASGAQQQLDRRSLRVVRIHSFQQVVGACGMDKECMKRALRQEDAKEGDLVVF